MIKIIPSFRNNKSILFLIVLIIFLIFRITLLVNCLHVINGSGIDGDECDECKLSGLAWTVLSCNNFTEVLQELSLTALFYRQMELTPVMGGQVVVSLLYVFVSSLFGYSYLSIKSLALFISFLSLLWWYVFLCRWFGQKTALFFSMFFIFMSPMVMRWTLTLWGGHPESVLFSIIIMYEFMHHLFGHGGKNVWRSAFFGLVVGFSLYFSYFCFITFFACIVTFFFVRNKNISWKPITVFCVFFLIGLSPWLLFNMKTGFWNLFHLDNDSSGGLFLVSDLGDGVKRFMEYVLHKHFFPPVLVMHQWGSFIINNIFKITFFISIPFLITLIMKKEKIKQEQRAAILLFLLHLFFFYGAMSFSGAAYKTTLDDRLYIVIIPVIYAVMAIFLCMLITQIKQIKVWSAMRYCVYAMIVLMVSVGIRDHVAFIQSGDKETAFQCRRLHYWRYGMNVLEMRFADDVNSFLTFIEHNKGEDNPLSEWYVKGFRHLFSAEKDMYGQPRWALPEYPHCTEIGDVLLRRIKEGVYRAGHTDTLMHHELTHIQKAVLLGVGWGLGVRCRWDREKFKKLISAFPDDWQPFLWHGIDRAAEYAHT